MIITNEEMTKLNVGQKIFYTGDMANQEGFGVIESIEPANKWHGECYNIKMEDGREWNKVQPVQFFKSPGQRFMTIEQYEQDRKERLERFEKQFSNR